MRRKASKSNYRPPNRSEKILAIVGLLVVGSLMFTAIAPNLSVKVDLPTEPPVTYIILTPNAPTETATPVATSGTPSTPTPGQAPLPEVTP
jgi:hypothetical protein